MELLYVWVDDFRLFSNTGFCLASDLKIEESFEVHEEIDIVNLKITAIQNSINLFPDCFSNVHGLIGENGAGKSTLLHLLALLPKDLYQIASRSIFVYRDENNEIRTIYFGGGKDRKPLLAKITYQGELENGIVLHEPEPYEFKYNAALGWELIFKENPWDAVTSILFTNIFDPHPEYLYKNFINLSTNFLLFKSIDKFLENFNKVEFQQGNEINPYNPLPEYYNEELRNQIRFIAWAKNKKLKSIPLPDELDLVFYNPDFQYIKSNKSTYAAFRIDDLDRLNKKAIENTQLITNPKERFTSVLVFQLFFYALRVDCFRQDLNGMKDFDNLNKEIRRIASSDSNVLEEFENFFLERESNSANNVLGKIIQIVRGGIEQSLLKCTFESNPENLFRYSFKIDENLWDILHLILDVQYLGDQSLLNYRWRGISSGENAFINQFSRFYEIKDNISTPNLLILIDEGELYFHPAWQKGYVNSLVEYLPNLFPDNKIQLVISSHSPFVVSDLTSNNLTFLKRGGIPVKFDRKETFGSNIHTLFTNSFFLNGLIGDFATAKIDSAIKYLNNEGQLDFENNDDVQIFISNIGEPLIREQLQKMLDSKRLEKLEGNYNSLEKRVQDLEEKTKEDD